MRILRQAESHPGLVGGPQVLHRTVNLRNFNPPNWNDDEMADHVINHMTNSWKHGPGGAGVWWTPHKEDTHSDTPTVLPDARNFPVQMSAEWNGDPSHLDPDHAGAGPTWKGWNDERVFHPGSPITLTSLQTYDEGDPLDPRPGSPWKEHLTAPRPWKT